MKFLADLISDEKVANIDELLNKELNNVDDIKFKSQKKNLAQKLSTIFDGYFLDGFIHHNCGNFLSRSLTAYVISKQFDMPTEEAAMYITDDSNDFGIDAIYSFGHRLYVYQTKFSKSISRNDIKEVKEGIHNILALDEKCSFFNEHIKARKNELTKILLDDDLKIVPVIVFFGHDLSSDVKNFLNNEIIQNTEYADFVAPYIVVNNETIFEYELKNQKIDEVFTLDRYFFRNEPVVMYAGCIKISFLKELYLRHKNALFSKNIRLLVQNSQINRQITNTLILESDKFLYYNNGITFVCDNIKVLPSSASSSTIKTLRLENLSIVNGAQTVHSCSNVDDIPDNALIQVRIIETKSLLNNDDFSLKITRYNNSQNAVSDMDLSTLDTVHYEIKKEFIKNGFYYLYRTGENIIDSEKTITFEDLMVSLGCFYGHARLVKNNKGELWSNTKLYSDLLKIKNYELFLCLCRIKKSTDNIIEKIKNENGFIVHWNRLILQLVYQKLGISPKNMEFSEEKIKETIIDIFSKIQEVIEQKAKHKNIYHRQLRSYEEVTDYILGNNNTSETIEEQYAFPF